MRGVEQNTVQNMRPTPTDDRWLTKVSN